MELLVAIAEEGRRQIKCGTLTPTTLSSPSTNPVHPLRLPIRIG